MKAGADDRVWVFDTCAIVQVRRLHNVGSRWPEILKKLTAVVDDGRMLFPREVLAELARVGSGEPDKIYRWAQDCGAKACRGPQDFEALKAVLRECPML